MSTNEYTDDKIITLEWNEHIRRRAGMYIGRLGDGNDPGDGIYVLLKETVDNSVDEFITGHGKAIIIENKIYASDQENQMIRYHNYAESLRSDYALLYLSLDGEVHNEEKTGKGDAIFGKNTRLSLAFQK